MYTKRVEFLQPEQRAELLYPENWNAIVHNDDLLCHTAKFEAFLHKNASTGYNELDHIILFLFTPHTHIH